MPSPDEQPKEYTLSIRTDDIHEAIAAAASALYALVQEALALREEYESEDGDFEIFARDILGTLTRHADQLSLAEPWGGDIDDGAYG